MKIIKLPYGDLSERQLDSIAERLRAGEIIIWPTDTLYGIACDALNVRAIERVCSLKHINPQKTNLSIACSNISQASEYARIDDMGFRLLHRYTPGPFTFLFPAASALPRTFKGRKVVGIRIPDCDLDIAIIRRLGNPLLTTSIEYADDDYAITPELISESYHDRVDIMIEGPNGRTELSTIVDCCSSDGPEIVRQGVGIIDL